MAPEHEPKRYVLLHVKIQVTSISSLVSTEKFCNILRKRVRKASKDLQQNRNNKQTNGIYKIYLASSRDLYMKGSLQYQSSKTCISVGLSHSSFYFLNFYFLFFQLRHFLAKAAWSMLYGRRDPYFVTLPYLYPWKQATEETLHPWPLALSI